MHLSTSVWLPLPRPRVFEFFADAANLQALTPPWLHFRIVTPMPAEMRTGTLIDYRISLRGIPLRWQSEITEWRPQELFVDEQRRGPYRSWRHVHRFEEADGGTFVADEVTFSVPCEFIVGWFVARDLRRIFGFRHAALARALGVPPPLAPEVKIAP
jgi:ligand-binding SRPBCC domain-containing protein